MNAGAFLLQALVVGVLFWQAGPALAAWASRRMFGASMGSGSMRTDLPPGWIALPGGKKAVRLTPQLRPSLYSVSVLELVKAGPDRTQPELERFAQFLRRREARRDPGARIEEPDIFGRPAVCRFTRAPGPGPLAVSCALEGGWLLNYSGTVANEPAAIRFAAPGRLAFEAANPMAATRP